MCLCVQRMLGIVAAKCTKSHQIEYSLLLLACTFFALKQLVRELQQSFGVVGVAVVMSAMHAVQRMYHKICANGHQSDQNTKKKEKLTTSAKNTFHSLLVAYGKALSSL